MSSKPSICFIAHNAYGVLAGKDTGHAGGIEIQVPLMARWFAAEGYQVSLICWSDFFSEDHDIDHVRVVGLCKKNKGIPIVRFVHPRWTSFYAALKRADADVYYYNCGDLGLGQLCLWAKRYKRKVVFSVAGDADCTEELDGLKQIRERVLYRHGLRRADKVVCQTEKQRQMLQKNYHIAATMIPMPSRGFTETSVVNYSANSDISAGDVKRVLWVGRFSSEKRLEWLLEVARQRKDIYFDVVGDANITTDYSRKLVETGAQLENVTLHGRVPHNQMGKFFKQADLLCSTSVYEGFPNIFLEAWSLGIPLVTTFDPDGVVERFGLGKTANSTESLVQSIDLMLQKEHWDVASNAAYRYFLNFHHPDRAMPKFQLMMEAVIKERL